MSKRWRQLFALGALSFLFFASGCASKPAQLTLFYTSDTHGRLMADDASVGMDVIAGARAATKDSLLVDGGDFLQGNSLVNFSQGKGAVALMKMSGYFAAAAGNHEFDFGREVLLERNAEAMALPSPMHLLSANVLREDGVTLLEAAALTTVGGVKVGLFGLTTTETAVQTHPKNVAGLRFAEAIPTARNMVAMLRAQGCQLIVALAHVGSADVAVVTSRQIADAVPGLDVLVDGHSHVELEYASPSGALAVSSGSHAQKLGRLVLTRDEGAPGGWLKSNTLLGKADLAGVSPAPGVSVRLAELRSEQAFLLAEVVGTAAVDLVGERTLVRTQETNLGSLCAEAMLAGTGADFALLNGGSIRRSITKGPITKGSLVEALPFSDAVITKSVTGLQLKEILEYGLSRAPMEFGGFPQFAGLRVVADLSRPAGQRIVAMTVASGPPLNLNRRYTLAVCDFLAAGGDGYPVLKGLPVDKIFLSPEMLLTKYLWERGAAAYAPLQRPRLILRGPQKSALPSLREAGAEEAA